MRSRSWLGRRAVAGAVVISALACGADARASCGDLTFPDAGLNECAQILCCQEVSACSSGTACASYMSCGASCLNGNCACSVDSGGAATYDSLSTCLSNNCQTDTSCGTIAGLDSSERACLAGKCCSESNTCQNDSLCTQIAECVFGQCATSGPSCTASCMKMGTASAQQHFDSLYACLGGCASSTTGAGGNGGTGGSTGVGGSGASTGVGGSGASTGSPSCGLGPPSLALDGNGSFVIPNPITTADFTIEVWLQTDVSGPATSDFFSGAGVIYGDMNNVQNAFGTAISGVSYIFGIGNPDQSVISVTPVVGLGWVHVAAVRSVEAGTITLVINGIAETPKPVVNTGVLSATTQLYVGGSEKYHFEGQLDEIRIWRVARSASEIASTMNQSLKGNEPDLIAYYPLHEGSGLEVSERVHGGSVALNGGNPPAPTWSSKCESSSQGQGGSGQPEGGSGNGEGAFGNSSSMGASDNAAAGAANPQTVAFFCSTHAGSSEPPPPPLSAAFLGMALGLVVRRRAVSR